MIQIFLDGSFYPRSQIGSYSIVITSFQNGTQRIKKVITDGPFKCLGSEIMETLAIIKAIKYCYSKKINNFEIISDSLFSVKKTIIFKELLKNSKSYILNNIDEIYQDFINELKFDSSIRCISDEYQESIFQMYTNLADVLDLFKSDFKIQFIPSHNKNPNIDKNLIKGNSIADKHARQCLKVKKVIKKIRI